MRAASPVRDEHLGHSQPVDRADDLCLLLRELEDLDVLEHRRIELRVKA